jgi:hypothetical protein
MEGHAERQVVGWVGGDGRAVCLAVGSVAGVVCRLRCYVARVFENEKALQTEVHRV